MSQRPRTRCPYTLKALTDLPKVNDEHILPDSIGGSYAFSVRADEATNSALGSTVDADFVDSQVLAMLRSQHGVKSRSGVAEWTMEGKTKDGDHPVEVTIPHAGKVDVHYKKPVVLDDTGMKGSIIVASDKKDAFIAKITENMAKKGKKLVISNDRRSENQEIHIQTTIDFHKIWVGLMKIAYLAAFEFLGDAFLDDPLNPEWQKGVRATSLAEFEQVRIRTLEVVKSGLFRAFLPPLADHEHGISVCDFNQGVPIVTVRLFNSDLLTMSFLASDTSNHGLKELEGKVVICDSRKKQVRTETFEDHFVRLSTGGTPHPPSGRAAENA